MTKNIAPPRSATNSSCPDEDEPDSAAFEREQVEWIARLRPAERTWLRHKALRREVANDGDPADVHDLFDRAESEAAARGEEIQILDEDRIAARVAEFIGDRLTPPAAPTTADELMTAAQAAAYLKLKAATIRELARSGRLPRHGTEHALRVRRSDLDALRPRATASRPSEESVESIARRALGRGGC
jgi:excisionase family DNA binding protein